MTAPAHIVGGDVAEPGAWPDLVAIEYPWGVGCTGTLVAPDLVLTAAHCIPVAKAVIIGANDYETEGERIDVIERMGHPEPFKSYDVGWLRLEHAAAAEPRAVVRDCLAAAVVDDAPAIIAGYGATNVHGTEADTLLREARIAIVDADCSASGRGCVADVGPGAELIAGGDGVDSCNGDSGGPLFLDMSGTSGGAPLLAGVTSRASAPAETPCGDGGIYVRVDAIVDWVESTSGVLLAPADCTGWNRPPAPVAAPIVVEGGFVATTVVDPNDPDDDQAHRFTIMSVPYGRASIDDAGLVTYEAPLDYVGSDDFVVRVTDDGDPRAYGEVTVAVDVRPAPVARGGACSTSPGASSSPPAWAPWVVIVAWLAVRSAVGRRSSGRTGSRRRASP